jgi:hypothetical protein
MHFVYFDQIHHLYYSLSPLLIFLKQFLTGFINLFAYLHIKSLGHIHPHNPLLLPPPSGSFPPKQCPFLYSYHSYVFRS